MTTTTSGRAERVSEIRDYLLALGDDQWYIETTNESSSAAIITDGHGNHLFSVEMDAPHDPYEFALFMSKARQDIPYLLAEAERADTARRMLMRLRHQAQARRSAGITFRSADIMEWADVILDALDGPDGENQS